MKNQTPHTASHVSRISKIQRAAIGLLAVMLAATTLMSFAAPAEATERSRSVERTRVEKVERVDTIKVHKVVVADGADSITPIFHGGGILCPAGTTPYPFDMPIYDDETGLWVVGYETVWFCIDDDLEPAG